MNIAQELLKASIIIEQNHLTDDVIGVTTLNGNIHVQVYGHENLNRLGVEVITSDFGFANKLEHTAVVEGIKFLSLSQKDDAN